MARLTCFLYLSYSFTACREASGAAARVLGDQRAGPEGSQLPSLLWPLLAISARVAAARGSRMWWTCRQQEWSRWQISPATVSYLSLLPKPLTTAWLPLPCFAAAPGACQKPGLKLGADGMAPASSAASRSTALPLRLSCLPLGVCRFPRVLQGWIYSCFWASL